jgi:hypothetical protein
MTNPDLDGPRISGRSDERIVHDWSIHPFIDDPAVKARMRKAIRYRARQALVEARMDAREREAFNRALIEEPERALGAIFGWTPGDDFRFGLLSPDDYDCAGDSGWSGREHLAGFDHLAWYYEDNRPVAIVSQPYLPAFEWAKQKGLVAEVERVRGVRVVELDATLGFYSLDPVANPTALVLWMRR